MFDVLGGFIKKILKMKNVRYSGELEWKTSFMISHGLQWSVDKKLVVECDCGIIYVSIEVFWGQPVAAAEKWIVEPLWMMVVGRERRKSSENESIPCFIF